MKRSPATTFFTMCIFLACFFDLKAIFNVDWYWHLFQYLPPEQIIMRFILSVTGRIIFIIAGIGLWQLKDWGRNLTIFLLFVNILILPWKHPMMSISYSLTYYPVPLKFHLLMNEIDAMFPYDISLVHITAWFLYFRDFVINAVMIFFFTRKSVKNEFQSGSTLPNHN